MLWVYLWAIVYVMCLSLEENGQIIQCVRLSLIFWHVSLACYHFISMTEKQISIQIKTVIFIRYVWNNLHFLFIYFYFFLEDDAFTRRVPRGNRCNTWVDWRIRALTINHAFRLGPQFLWSAQYCHFHSVHRCRYLLIYLKSAQQIEKPWRIYMKGLCKNKYKFCLMSRK